MRLVIVSFLMSLCVLPIPEQAEAIDSPFSFEVKSDFYSDYIFRGINRFEGTSIQPSISGVYETGQWGSVGATIWAHFSAESTEPYRDNITEIDHRLYYLLPLDVVNLSVGHVWYTFPKSSELLKDTSEYFLSLSHNSYLSPTFSFYHDYDRYDYQYYELGIKRLFEVPGFGRDFNFSPFINVGFASDAKDYFEANGLVQSTYGVLFNAKFGLFDLVPMLSYTVGHSGRTDSEFRFGFSVALKR